MAQFPDIGGVGAIETPDEHVHARRRRPWLAPTLGLALAAVVGGWVLVERCGAAQAREDVEALTADAHEFVRLVRGSLPADWSIERVVEFPTLRPGSQALQGLRDQRGQARVNLEQKVLRLVPAADQPDLAVWTPWISNPSWMSRDEVIATAGTLRQLDRAIARLRGDAGLSPSPLALDGAPPPAIPRPLDLPPLPDGVDMINADVWTVPPAAVFVRYGRRAGQCRDRAGWCVHFQATWVSWDGAVIDDEVLAPPPEHAAWSTQGVGVDGTVYTAFLVGADVTVASYGPARPPTRVVTTLPELAQPLGRYGIPAPGIETTVGGARLRVVTADGLRHYRLGAGGVLSPADVLLDPFGVGSVALGEREGGATMYLTGGARLVVERKDDTVFATVATDEGETPDAVTRLADYAPPREDLLRRMWGADGRVALMVEGSRGALKVFLSTDEGRTWRGAPDRD